MPLTSPTARKRPFGLMSTLVTALILSLDDHVSLPSAEGEALYEPTFSPNLPAGVDLARDSGVVGGVSWL